MKTFTELVKEVQNTKTKNPTEIIEDVVVSNISVGNKILEIVSKNTSGRILRTNRGWIKTFVRDLTKRKNINPSKLNKIQKHIYSVNCSEAEYLMLGGDATKQLLSYLHKGLDFQTAINLQYKESE